MPRKSLIVRSYKTPKYSTRRHFCCLVCGRFHAVHHRFLLCRIHLREYFNRGLIPGFRKASW